MQPKKKPIPSTENLKRFLEFAKKLSGVKDDPVLVTSFIRYTGMKSIVFTVEVYHYLHLYTGNHADVLQDNDGQIYNWPSLTDDYIGTAFLRVLATDARFKRMLTEKKPKSKEEILNLVKRMRFPLYIKGCNDLGISGLTFTPNHTPGALNTNYIIYEKDPKIDHAIITTSTKNIYADPNKCYFLCKGQSEYYYSPIKESKNKISPKIYIIDTTWKSCPYAIQIAKTRSVKDPFSGSSVPITDYGYESFDGHLVSLNQIDFYRNQFKIY